MMNHLTTLLKSAVQSTPHMQSLLSRREFVCKRCAAQIKRQAFQIPLQQRRHASRLRQQAFRPQLTQRRYASHQPADDASFESIVDKPARLIRLNRKHNIFGLAILAAIPIISFTLGCWQIKRLGWKSELIARFEDRLIREPLPLPPRIDPEAIKDFDYRRVYARGVLRHDQEMLIGPRLHDGQDGYLVVTPLDRSAEFPSSSGSTKILVNRGWIPKTKAAQSTRPDGLQKGEVVVEGLLRDVWKKNLFTPSNRPKDNIFHFPDVYEMAEHTGSQPVWIEETMDNDLLVAYDRENRGIPIGRPAEVNLRNNHAQYIFTWFSLSAATSIMMWMILKKPASSIQSRVRQSRSW